MSILSYIIGEVYLNESYKEFRCIHFLRLEKILVSKVVSIKRDQNTKR